MWTLSSRGGRVQKESSIEKRNDRYFFYPLLRERRHRRRGRRRRSRSSILVPIVIIIGSSIIRGEERLLYDDDVTTLYKILLFVIPAVVYPRSSPSLSLSLSLAPRSPTHRSLYPFPFYFFLLFFTCLFRSPTLSLSPVRSLGTLFYTDISDTGLAFLFGRPRRPCSVSLSFSVPRGIVVLVFFSPPVPVRRLLSLSFLSSSLLLLCTVER